MNALSTFFGTLLGGADVSSDSLTTAVVGLVVSGVVATLGFLLRNAFGKVEASIERVDAKLDRVLESQAAHDTARAVLEQRVLQSEKEIAELKAIVRELREGAIVR